MNGDLKFHVQRERTKPVQNGRIATTSRTNLSIYQRRLKFDISGRWLSSVEPPKIKVAGSNFLRDRIHVLSHGRARNVCTNPAKQTINTRAFFRLLNKKSIKEIKHDYSVKISKVVLPGQARESVHSARDTFVYIIYGPVNIKVIN